MMRQFLAVMILGAALAAPGAAQRYSCVFTDYGKSCGPALKGTVVPNGYTNYATLSVSKVQPRARLLFMVGGVRLDVPLMPIFGGSLDCRLLLDPVFFQYHLADDLGNYSFGRAVSSTFAGVAHVQYAELRETSSGGLEVLTTNGTTFECK